MKFCFGRHDIYERHILIEAKNFDHAIKIFKVSVLFPEKYVDPIYVKKDAEGCFESDYDSDLSRYSYQFKIPDPKIPIFDDQDKRIGTIGLQECINVDFSQFIPQKNLLEATKIPGKNLENQETLPVITSAESLSRVNSKVELRAKHDEIARRKAELEKMMSEMNQAMSILKDELKQKQKIIYIIETYLGLHEEIVQIADGESAPSGTPLSLFQQKLFMDEEVGIWDDSDGQGLDFQDIEQFDKWIAKNYKTFAYEPLSVVAWQVRRNEKEYSDKFLNVQFNQWNKQTYFLIRNGSKLYRIWSDISISDLLFPEKNEYVNLVNSEKRWGEKHVKEKLQRKHENYLYGLIAIQGMIERTDILGTYLREHGVNLMTPRSDMDEHVKFIRDAETEFWIGNGRLGWSEYLKNNRSTIHLGSRICISTQKNYFSFSSKDNDRWRCSPFRPSCPPYRDYCYVVESFKSESPKEYFPEGTSILIRYKPGDTIWDPVTFEEKERKRRVPWYLYSDEVVNFDEVSIEDADYYMKSRIDRKNYLRILPTLFWIRKIKSKEKELEDEFAKMIAGQLKWELNDHNKNKIQKAIVWWKLKNKWKRAITIKESTASSMIIRRLKNENQ
ncbi:MAG: hypothetical protein PHF86_09795 [Candidatus Nanoarchaeia archaeon]|nr:hypothetical protein [Candidatus Nanoarchaeia archaeon]